MTQPSQFDEPTPFDIAAGMQQMLENLGPVREAILGYKQQLVADGWNEHHAERMAMDFHAAIMRGAFRQGGPS